MQNAETVVKLPFTEQFLLPFLIYYYLESGNSITLWTMPNSQEKHLLICSDGLRHIDELLLEESETGFVFASYDSTQKKIFFRGDLIFTFKNGVLSTDNLPEDVINKIPARKNSDHLQSKTYPVLPFAVRSVPGDYRALV